jgi:hypothetical protein
MKLSLENILDEKFSVILPAATPDQALARGAR